MPRLSFLDENELPADVRELLRVAEAAGSPDPRVLKILFKSPIGVAWYRYWLASSNDGVLPKDLKELCRVKIAFDHECGYCGTVRSAAAKAAGLTEEEIIAVAECACYEGGKPMVVACSEMLTNAFAACKNITVYRPDPPA